MKLLYALCFMLAATFSMQVFAEEKITTVSAKINDPVSSSDRATKYEEPLDKALKDAKLGEVTGGGNSVGAHGKIEWAGVDIEINDVSAGIALIKQTLLNLGAPKGTVLEYHAGGKKVVVPVQ